MNIKLISPLMTLRPMDSEFKRRMSPPFSLLVLAALTPAEHTVILEDENLGRLNLNDSPDLVGITVNVDTSRRAYAIAAQYRKRNIPVVLGGIHPSANPQEAGQFCNAVCIGEAETLWPRILDDTRSNRLQPQYYSAEPIDLSLTPLPRWDILDASDYLYTNILCTSRGCPFRCEFCYNSSSYIQHEYRNRPVDRVIQEIESLNTRQVMFIDDNFIGNINWTREFVNTIAPMKLVWHAAVSANIGRHPELLDAMAGAGCKSLFIGFESINHHSIQSVNKVQNDCNQYDNIIRMLHERGIMVNASMAFGLDCDTPQTFPDTLDWLVHNRVETVTAHILTPYPGTKLYERFQAENRIIDTDWSHYNTAHVVYRPRNMTPEQLYNGYRLLYSRFYYLANILRRLPRNPRLKVPYLLFNLGYRKFGKVTSLASHFGLLNRMGTLTRRLCYGIE
jgi:radical SAM superfamily enzyme YgiQ (UPF0313 family)